MDNLEDENMKALLEKMLKSAKRIPEEKNNLTQKPLLKQTGREELVLRLLRIQEHIITTMPPDQKTSSDIGNLLDRVTVLLEQRH